MRIFAAISKRVIQLAAVSLLIASATFFLSTLLPGDFFSAQELDPAIRRQTVDLMRHRYGMDQPVVVQYGQWLTRCFRLDFGDSRYYQQPVRQVVLDSLARTLWMGLPALAIGMLAGMLIGMIHAINRENRLGITLEFLSTLALALPTIILGLCALLLAAWTRWFPLGGMGSSSLQDVQFWTWLSDRIYHLVLPVSCLTVPVLVYVEKIQCTATQELIHEPYVRAAYARGLPRLHVWLHYLIRPALNPILSTSGPLFAGVLGGSLVLEVIFAWPGLGQATLNALLSRDTTLVVGCVAGSTILLVVGNLFADILLLLLDPRARVGEGNL